MISELLLLTGCIKITYPPTALTSNIRLQHPKAVNESSYRSFQRDEKNCLVSWQKHIHSTSVLLVAKQSSLFLLGIPRNDYHVKKKDL